MYRLLRKWKECFGAICLLGCVVFLLQHRATRLNVWKRLTDQKSFSTPDGRTIDGERLDVEATFENKDQIITLYEDICQAYGANISIVKPWIQFKSIILVIIFNDPSYEDIPNIELLYRPFFPRIVYCISNGDKDKELKNWNLTYIYYESYPQHSGHLNYICVNNVHQLGLKAEGFLFVTDDLLISLLALADFPLRVPAAPHKLPRACSISSPAAHCTQWSYFKEGAEQLTSLRQALSRQPEDSLGQRCTRALQNTTGLQDPLVHSLALVYFIPAHFMADASDLFKMFYDHNVFHEVAMVHVLICLAWPSWPYRMEGDAIWPTKNDPFRAFKTLPRLISGKDMFLNAMKLSHVLKKDPRYVEPFCKTILPYYHRASCMHGADAIGSIIDPIQYMVVHRALNLTCTKG